MRFLDEARVTVRSGRGGAGCVSFRRERHIEFGGPDGGGGGRGGDVVLECVGDLNTLIDFRYRQHFAARNGRPGEGSNKTGASADPVVLRLPPGTEVLDQDGATLLADVVRPGHRIVLLTGGGGGRGNASFKSSTRRTPRHAEPGRAGEERRLLLRLKLIADVGLIGLPNAGKSSLLARVSRARPRIADYAFTTLHPQLGVVERPDDAFVIADLPGLVRGAHRNVGLGDRFLGHAERCACLLHLVDGAARDAAADYAAIRAELDAYGRGLERKPAIVALSKIDTLDPDARERAREALAGAAGDDVLALSSVSGEGVEETLERLRERLRADAARPVRAEAALG